jgi:hypothetical protein
MHIVWLASDMLDPKSIIILVFAQKISMLILYHQHLLLFINN